HDTRTQDLGRCCHHFTLPSGRLPRLSNRWASEAISLRKSPSCRLSLGACAFDFGSSMPNSRAGAPPNSSASGPTKPMVPPQPIATGGFLNPCFIADTAASKAGPLGSVIHQFTELPAAFTVTLPPHGGSAVR